MKKTYNATLDDLIEVHFRLGELAGIINRQKIQGATIVVVVAAVICLFSFSSVREQLVGFIIFSFFSCMAVIALVPYSYRRELRKYIIKIYGSEGPFESEFELTEEGVIYRNESHSLLFKWNAIVSIIENEKYIELITSPLGMVRFQKKHFNDHEIIEWKSFIFLHSPSLKPSTA